MLLPITPENLSVMHPQSRKCVYWEIFEDVDDPAFEKEAWLTTTLLNYGTCGFTIDARATILFCHRDLAPGASHMPTAPISSDAEIITSLFLSSDVEGRGIEAVLLDTAVMELTQRGATAVEAFGYRDDPVPYVRKPAQVGLIRAEVLEAGGFTEVVGHPVLPRFRLELPPAHDLLSAAAVEELLVKALAG